MDALKKVLIVEDLWYLHHKWEDQLNGRVILISALSIEDAQKKFNENPDIALVTMDGCVNNDEDIDTEPLVRKFRETFKGPIIAASRSSSYRRWLIQAGCSHECSKDQLVQKIIEVLGL